jgi:hypothetical protein
MSNIVLYPSSGILEFNTGVAGSLTLDNSLSGASRFRFNSGEINLTNYATGNLNRFSIDGSQGRLFLIDDNLSGSLFSVNTIAGLPVLEAFSDNRVILGEYGKYNLIVSGGSVGIGGLPNTGTQKLYVSGNLVVGGNLGVSGTLNLGTVSTSAGSSYNIGFSPFFVYAGSVLSTGIMPLISSSVGSSYFIKNRGTAIFTLSGSGSDQFTPISGTGAFVRSVPMVTGQAHTIINDGLYWNVMTKLI